MWLEDLEWVASGLQIIVRQSKTDQFAWGQMVNLHRATRGHCPCVALQMYLAIRPLGGTLLLVHQDGAQFWSVS